MLLRTIIAAALVASSCSIICGAACDFEIGYPCMAPRGLFGPCVDNECAPGLLCFSSLSGDSCVPPLSAGEAWETSECAAEVGGDLRCAEADGFCSAMCDDDDPDGPCSGGSVCDTNTNTCVHPYE